MGSTESNAFNTEHSIKHRCSVLITVQLDLVCKKTTTTTNPVHSHK